MIAWGIAASAGMQAQVRALAEALGATLEMKSWQMKPAFGWLPNSVFAAGLKHCVFPYMVAGNSISEDMPDMVISCGRRPAIVAMGLQAHIPQDTTKFIHIQDPHIDPKHFDVVVAMQHDAVQGDNVLHTRYALHSITQEKLAEASTRFAPLFADLPTPYVAVLLGGSTNKYRLTEAGMQEVMASLRAMLASMSGSLLITVSGRTGQDNIRLLKEALADDPRVYLYDGEGENPYLGLLAAADTIVVTNDSVNMMSEAAATGKPLYLLPLPGHSKTKPARFADMLVQEGTARLWGNAWESWPVDIGKEMQELEQKIKNVLSIGLG